MLKPNELTIFGDAINDLLRNLREGGFSLHMAPALIKQILGKSKFKKPMWKRFEDPSTGRVCEFDHFEEFVRAPLLEGGLNTDLRTLKNICRDDPESLDMIDMALVRGRGGNHNPDGKNQYEKEVNGNIVTIDLEKKSATRPEGNSRLKALRRLRQSRPDLHAQVLSGEISAHAAMIQAGFRRKTITVPVEVNGAAKAISRYFNHSEIQELVTHLTKGIGQNAE